MIGVIRDVMPTILDALNAAFHSVWDAISGAINTAWNIIKPILQAMQDALNAVMAPIQGVLGGAGKIAGGIGKIAGGIAGFLYKGGDAVAGRQYVVGERGPEIFTPGASGTVTPNNALGGGVTLHLSITVQGSVTSERDLIETVGSGLVDRLRRAGVGN